MTRVPEGIELRDMPKQACQQFNVMLGRDCRSTSMYVDTRTRLAFCAKCGKDNARATKVIRGV